MKKILSFLCGLFFLLQANAQAPPEQSPISAILGILTLLFLIFIIWKIAKKPSTNSIITTIMRIIALIGCLIAIFLYATSTNEKKTNDWVIPIIALGYLLLELFAYIEKEKQKEKISQNQTNNNLQGSERQFQNEQPSQSLINQTDLDQLEKLHILKEKGIITEDEFNIKKKEFFKT